MATCLGCGILRKDLSTPCSICGHKPENGHSHRDESVLTPPIQITSPPAPQLNTLEPTLLHLLQVKASRYRGRIITITAVLLVIYICSPYISLYRFYRAIKEEDAEAISYHIDFPSIRVSIKEQFNSYMAKSIADHPEGNNGALNVLVSAIAPSVFNSMVDAYVTPANISIMLRSPSPFAVLDHPQGKQDPYQSNTPSSELHIQYAFFSTPTTFLVKLKNANCSFNICDWSWKLVDVRLAKATITALTTPVRKPTITNEEMVARWHAREDLESLKKLLNLYWLDKKSYPTTAQGLNALLAIPGQGKEAYLKRRIIDPWHHEYVYHCPGLHHPTFFDLSSKGADGIEGTNDDVNDWK